MKKIIYLFSLSVLLFLPTISDAQYWNPLIGTNGLGPAAAVYAICSDAAGNVYAAGSFTNFAGHHYVAKYDGTVWSELGGTDALAANAAIYNLYCDPSGNVYASGYYTDGANSSTGNNYVAKYNGTSWSNIGPFSNIGGSFFGLGQVCGDVNGNIYAAGVIDSSGQYCVARHNGSTWSKLNGFSPNGSIYDMCLDPSGNLYVSGDFTNDSGYNYIAKYNGVQWSSLGDTGGIASGDGAICSDSAGNIYGISYSPSYFGLAKYDGTVWSQYGGSQFGGHAYPYSVCSDTGGHIFLSIVYSIGVDFTHYIMLCDDTSRSTDHYDYNSEGGVTLYSDGRGNVYGAATFNDGMGIYYIAKYARSGLNPSEVITIAQDDAIHVSPNPNTGTFTISAGKDLSNVTIKVANPMGQTMIEKTNQSGRTFTLDIAGYAAGIYLVSVEQADHVWKEKIVKAN